MQHVFAGPFRLFALIAGLLMIPIFTPVAMAEQETSASETHLIILFDTREDSVEEFAAIMAGVEAAMATEEGFQSATVYRNSENPLQFTLVERWDSVALHREHYDRIVASGDWAHILSLLSAEPVMSYNSQM